MNTSLADRQIIDDLVLCVQESNLSDFYRNIWKSAAVFDDLPYVSRVDLVAASLSSRRYKHEKGMIKIVDTGDNSFLSEWSFSDIGAESYAPRSMRPMVYLSNSYEVTEKAMWCYENNMTPLIAEKDPDLAMYAAARYRIDSLITDEQSLGKLTPFFNGLAAPLSSITVIGDTFSPQEIMPFERYAHAISLVLALPETGVIAQAPLTPSPRFVASPDCVLEREDEIVVTKKHMYPTPIIRYRTGIPSAVLG